MVEDLELAIAGAEAGAAIVLRHFGGAAPADFHSATGVLEDAYFNLVGEAGGRA